MSQPKLPEVNPDITRESALNMILASIAMEELALSHIVNAEGEKLQYVLGTLDPCNRPCKDKKRDIDDILAVNDSITRLLEGVSQNEMLLKNKMDKVLQAMSEECPCHSAPPPNPEHCCPDKCTAVFKENKSGNIWREGHSLPWKREHIHGRCVIFNPGDNTKVTLLSKCRYMIGFAVNLKCKSAEECKVSINLRMAAENRRSDIFTHHCSIPACSDSPITASASGIIVEPSGNTCAIFLELTSPVSMIVDSSMLTIVEI